MRAGERARGRKRKGGRKRGSGGRRARDREKPSRRLASNQRQPASAPPHLQPADPASAEPPSAALAPSTRRPLLPESPVAAARPLATPATREADAVAARTSQIWGRRAAAALPSAVEAAALRPRCRSATAHFPRDSTAVPTSRSRAPTTTDLSRSSLHRRASPAPARASALLLLAASSPVTAVPCLVYSPTNTALPSSPYMSRPSLSASEL